MIQPNGLRVLISLLIRKGVIQSDELKDQERRETLILNPYLRKCDNCGNYWFDCNKCPEGSYPNWVPKED